MFDGFRGCLDWAPAMPRDARLCIFMFTHCKRERMFTVGISGKVNRTALPNPVCLFEANTLQNSAICIHIPDNQANQNYCCRIMLLYEASIDVPDNEANLKYRCRIMLLYDASTDIPDAKPLYTSAKPCLFIRG